MKQTLKKVKSLLAFMLAFVMVIAMSVPVGATTDNPGEVIPPDGINGDWTKLKDQPDVDAPITVTGLNEGDKIGLYQVIEGTYHSNNNTLTYDFSEGFKRFLKEATEYNDDNKIADYLDEYLKFGDNSTELKEILGDYTAWVKKQDNWEDSSLGFIKSGAANDNGRCIFGNQKLGQYIAVFLGNGDNATRVYQTVTIEVEPSIYPEDGEYYLKTAGYTATMKSEDIDIDKETPEDEDGYNIGDSIPYTVKITVPVYDEGATNTTLYMGDKMSEGLTFNNDVKVYGKTEGEVDNDKFIGHPLVEGTDYSVITEGNQGITNGDATFYVNFKYENVKQYSQLVVQYSATLNENAVIGDAGNTNDAELVYTNDPFDGTTSEPGGEGGEGIGTDEDEVTIKTYGLAIKKIDGEDKKVLANATFDLYAAKDVTVADMDPSDGIVVPGQINDGAKPVVSGLTTDESGYIAADGLAKGTYYLKETKAPSGYNIIDGFIKVVVDNVTNTITTTKNYTYTTNPDNAIIKTQAWKYDTNGTNKLYAWIDTADGITESKTVEWKSENPGEGYQAAYLLSVDTTVETDADGTGYDIVTVENNKGAQLPSTGGTGRKVFYVVGPILMVGAGIIFVTRKRMERKDS